MTSRLSAFPFIGEGSEATPGLWNQPYSIISANMAALDFTQSGVTTAMSSSLSIGADLWVQGSVLIGVPPSTSTRAALKIGASSALSDYIEFSDSSAQKSTYLIGSRVGGTADGLNIYDESGSTMIVSFSKQSVRFYQNVVGPVFDIGGALAKTYNAATFGTGADSRESRIQAAINQAVIDNFQRVNIPASMLTYSAASVSFSSRIQMVREGGDWSVYEALAYGATGNDVVDDTSALSAALAHAALNSAAVVFNSGHSYLLTSAISIPSGTSGLRIIATGAQLRQATADSAILLGRGVFDVRVIEGLWKGASQVSFTDPNMGLIYFRPDGASVACRDIRIEACEVTNGSVGISGFQVNRLWVNDCYIHDLGGGRPQGIQASSARNFFIRGNRIVNILTNSDNAYGIQATGDDLGGSPQDMALIEGNLIDNIPAWDGIGTHECTNLIVNGNVFRGVRNGIDVGHANATNLVQKIVITNNVVSSTTSNAWAGNSATAFGIAVLGFNATSRCSSVIIKGNVVDGWLGVTGTTVGGTPGSIVVGNIDHCIIQGNVVSSMSTPSATLNGIGVSGTVNDLIIDGNTIQGGYNAGIRANAVLVNSMVVTNNVFTPNNPATMAGISITASTITLFTQHGNLDPSTAAAAGQTYNQLANVLRLPAGTALEPASAFTSESSLGWYRSAASTMALSYGTLRLPGVAVIGASDPGGAMGVRVTPGLRVSGNATGNSQLLEIDNTAASGTVWRLGEEFAAGSFSFRHIDGVTNPTVFVIDNNALTPASASGLTLGTTARPFSGLVLSNGAAIAPRVTFSSESSLGLYRSGTSTLALSYGTIDLTSGGAVTSVASLTIKSGSNNACGSAVLGSNGSVNVANTYVKTGDLIFLTDIAPGGTIGTLEMTGIRNSSGFTIASTNVADTSTVAWLIVRPG